MKDKHFTSRMLIIICAKLAYGGIFFAAAACMFFAARNFRILEDQKENEDQEAKADHGQE